MEKIIGIAILTVVGSQLVKKQAGEIALLLSIAAAVFVGLWSVDRLQYVVAALSGLFAEVGLYEGYGQILMKIVGLAYIGELGSALCKDAGCQALAEQIGIAAKFSILSVSIPVFLQLVEVMGQFGQ